MTQLQTEEGVVRVPAGTWNVDPATCHAQNHAIVHQPTGRRLGFGELVKVAADLPLPSADHLQLRFKPPAARRYVDKPVPIVDLADIVRGRATYGIDVVVSGLKPNADSFVKGVLFAARLDQSASTSVACP